MKIHASQTNFITGPRALSDPYDNELYVAESVYGKERTGFYRTTIVLPFRSDWSAEAIDREMFYWYGIDHGKDYQVIDGMSPLYQIGFRVKWNSSDKKLFSVIRKHKPWQRKNVIIETRLICSFENDEWYLIVWHTLPLDTKNMPNDLFPPKPADYSSLLVSKKEYSREMLSIQSSINSLMKMVSQLEQRESSKNTGSENPGMIDFPNKRPTNPPRRKSSDPPSDNEATDFKNQMTMDDFDPGSIFNT